MKSKRTEPESRRLINRFWSYAFFSFCLIQYLTASPVLGFNNHFTPQTKEIIPDSVTIAADTRYQAGSFRTFWMGSHYRDIWSEPVKMRVLNMEEFENGLEIYNTGGGQQTLTMFARTGEGGHYVLRTIPKIPVVFAEDQDDPVQIMFNNSVIRDVLQDQISSAHPYAPLSTEPIAKAAGIYFNNLELFYLPDQPALDGLSDQAKDVVVIKEPFVELEHIREKFDDNAIDIHGTTDVIRREIKGGMGRVDDQWYLRTRLVEMLLGDWDRHEGQYFWIETIHQGETVYRPFPLDHDNNFFVMTGVLPSMATRARAMRKFQHFGTDIREISGLNEQARYIEEFFLNEVPKSVWIEVARDLQNKLTNDVLREAVERLPSELSNKSKETLYHKLQSRREKLVNFAEEYYNILAEDIDVVGTENSNTFKISENTENSYLIEMAEIQPDGSRKKLFSRVIHSDETRSVRLFGMKGKNSYEFDITNSLPFTVHIVDLNSDRNITFRGNSSRKNITVHGDRADIPPNHQFKFNTRNFTKELLNTYGFNYQEANDDLFEIIPSFRYTGDDGLILGGGFVFTTYRFRRYPYSARQQLTARLATQTTGYNITYKGEFINVLGGESLNLDVFMQAPNYSNNFFGFGNETNPEGNSRFFDVRKDIFGIEAEATYRLTDATIFKPAITFESVTPDRTINKFFFSEASGLSEDDFDTHNIFGIKVTWGYEIGDKELFPRNRFEIETGAHMKYNFFDDTSLLSLTGNINGSSSIFHPDLVLASRIGTSTLIGDFRFFQANTLGGVGSLLRSNKGFFESANFRGLPRDRFSGRSVFYHNTELRAELFHIRGYLLPGDFGILALFDHGRVWAPGESSDVWHYAYGGGVWYNFYKNVLLSSTYSVSDVDSRISLVFGFLF